MTNTSTNKVHDLSIVIVTYNSSNNIVALLESLNDASQEIIKEIIIIENNSPDRALTSKRVKSCIKQISSKYIKYIQSENNDGFAKSCNRGAKIATGEHILFLNPDTEVKKDSLSTLMKHFISTKSDIMGGLAVRKDGKPHNAAVRTPTILTALFEFTNLGKLFHNKHEHKRFYYEDIQILNSTTDKSVDAVSGAYLLIDRSSFEKLNGFDERYFMYLEDVDLGVRANKMNMKVTFCPHSVIFHEGGASSKNKYSIHHQAWFDSRRKYYLIHFGYISNVLLQPIFYIEELILKKIRLHK